MVGEEGEEMVVVEEEEEEGGRREGRAELLESGSGG